MCFDERIIPAILFVVLALIFLITAFCCNFIRYTETYFPKIFWKSHGSNLIGRTSNLYTKSPSLFMTDDEKCGNNIYTHGTNTPVIMNNSIITDPDITHIESLNTGRIIFNDKNNNIEYNKLYINGVSKLPNDIKDETVIIFESDNIYTLTLPIKMSNNYSLTFINNSNKYKNIKAYDIFYYDGMKKSQMIQIIPNETFTFIYSNNMWIKK